MGREEWKEALQEDKTHQCKPDILAAGISHSLGAQSIYDVQGIAGAIFGWSVVAFFSFGTFSFLYPAYLFYAAFLFMVYKFATCFSNSGATSNKKVLILKLINGPYLKVSSGKCCYLKI